MRVLGLGPQMGGLVAFVGISSVLTLEFIASGMKLLLELIAYIGLQGSRCVAGGLFCESFPRRPV